MKTSHLAHAAKDARFTVANDFATEYSTALFEAADWLGLEITVDLSIEQIKVPPRYRAADTLQKRFHALLGNTPPNPANTRLLVALVRQQYRCGVPVLVTLKPMWESAKMYSWGESLSSDWFRELLLDVVAENHGPLEELKAFLSREFGAYLIYNRLTQTLEPTEVGLRRGYDGNFEEAVVSKVWDEFGPRTYPRATVVTVLQGHFSSAHASATPTEELSGYLQGYRDTLPTQETLAATVAPRKLSEATGAWADLRDSFKGLWDAYNLTDPLEQELLVRGLLGVVQRQLVPGCPMQWALTLMGGAGTGKSMLGEVMALTAAPAVQASIGDIRYSEVLGASVLVFDELDTQLGPHKELAHMKSFITTTRHRARLSYRRNAQTIPATWSVICTTNADSLPYDDGAGMRRYGVVRVTGDAQDGQRRYEFLKANRERLLAALYLLHLGGYSCNLDAELLGETAPTSEAIVATSDEGALLGAVLPYLADFVTEGEGFKGFTTSNMWHLVAQDFNRPTPNRRVLGEFAKVLVEAGWVQKLTRSRSRVWVPEDYTNSVFQAHPQTREALERARVLLLANLS